MSRAKKGTNRAKTNRARSSKKRKGTTTTTTTTTTTITAAAAAANSSGNQQTTSPPPQPSTSPSRNPPANAKTCLECNKAVSSKAFADHIKVHRIATDEHGIAAVVPCRNCAARGRECRIPRNPGHNGLHTYRCKHCLQYHENCSYLADIRSMTGVPVHPGMGPSQLSSPDRSEGSDTSQ